MRNFIKEYVISFMTYVCNKLSTQKAHGLLHSFNSIVTMVLCVMDFITKLPASSYHTGILVMIKIFTKEEEFIFCDSAMTVGGKALLFLDCAFHHHVLPKYIISD